MMQVPTRKVYIEQALFMLDGNAAVTRMKNRYNNMINSWSSTLWEDFTESNSNAGYSSNNHAWSAGPLYLMSAYLLGVRPAEAAFTTFTFLPQPGGVTQFSGVIPTVKGNITAGFSAGSTSFHANTDFSSGNYLLLWVFLKKSLLHLPRRLKLAILPSGKMVLS